MATDDKTDPSRAPSLPDEVLRWNQTQKAYPLDRSVISYFEQQVREAPHRLAVQFEGVTLSYGELNRRANRLARELVARGVKADDFVGVCMQRSAELVVALVGVVKAGAAYVPFDPEYPRDRLDYMFNDSGARLVLTHQAVQGIAFPATMTPLRLDEPALTTTGPEDDVSPEFRGRPDTAVYMIYTSGSTGKPKGVPNLHRGLANRLLWMQEAFHLGPDDRVLQKTPFSFDVSVWEFFWPLMVGASICVAKPGGHRDNRYLVEVIASAGVTTLHFVPSMLGLFLTADGLDRLGSLRRVMCSGEALPYELTRRFFEKLPGKELHNLYGPTEASIDVTWWPCKPDTDLNVIPIGFPIANTRTYILDEHMKALPVGEVGELHLGGVQLARGYWNRPELTAERFVPDPFSSEPGARLYKTGDLARYLPSGAIEYLGRIDFQVKLRGFRIELGEIEAVLLKQAGVRDAVVTATEGGLEEKQLVAYLVAGPERPAVSALKEGLLKELPEYMVPARFMFLEVMPLSPNGKVDRKALPKVVNQRPELAEMFAAPQTPLQRDLCKVWRDVLDIDRVGIKDNFFDLGGNSLQLLKLVAAMKAQLGQDIPAVKVFQFPSVEKLAAHLSGSSGDPLMDDAFQRVIRGRGQLSDKHLSGAVAIIGMVGRFPGAATLDQLWTNLLNDVESISRFTPEELAEGVDEETRNDPNYVPCRGVIDDADKFDATFFGIGPQEAKVMDPQQRVFLEMAWHALEDAGYDPGRFPGMIGVYAGVGDNHYYYNNVLCHPELVKTVGKMIVGYGNEKDYIATRVSFQLDLTGPSVSATTGCSTALLAIDNAVKALNAFECDMALAGGVDIMVPQKSGQIHQAGGPFTNDGHCRPFDADASGTMFCDGAAAVVVRRLEDAVAAGDHIYGVVLGSAKNNDGAQKVSFLAPSVEGQARVIALAQAQANVQADSISYVEAHGTGTPLGDPIELEALTKAFRATTDKKHFCKIGSIKGHIGHPTIASGIAGFIKVALALEHEEIPGTLHFKSPNPRFDLTNSPFEILAKRTPWPRGPQPRRGAVSSFGFGGTNVHAILEEAPPAPPSGPGRAQQLLLLSAKSPAALERLRKQYAVYLGAHPEVNLADVAYTLQVGRKHLAYRDFVVAPGGPEAISQLVASKQAPAALNTLDPGVVFLFPGQGAQYANMGRDLYRSEPEFRTWMDRCCDLFRPHLDRDLRELLFPPEGQEAAANELLTDTGYTQPAMFAIELSLARWWMSLGVRPSAVIGHSIGEFVGACLGGVFALEDVIPLVALRARLIRNLPRGTMLSVRCPAKDLEGKLPPDVQLAASNGPSLCVVAGPTEAVNAYAKVLEAQGVNARPLHTSHAFHSAMMDPIVGEFRAAAAKLKVGAPTIPFLSTALAGWVTEADQLGADYWSQHIRRPVLFADSVGKALAELDPGTVFLEVGPRDVLSTLSRMQAAGPRKARVLASLGESGDPAKDLAAVTATVGRLWANGVSVDWAAYRGEQQRRRLPLPTYPFERKSHWLEPLRLQVVSSTASRVVEGAAAPVATAAAVSEPLVVRAGRADEAGAGQPVKGLRLGRDPQGRLAWFAPEAGQPGRFAPLAGKSPAGHDPFAPPARKVLAATPAQQEIWRVARGSAAAAKAFHEAFSIRFSGPMDDAALAAAIQGLGVIHEVVRGHFASDGKEFVIEPQAAVPVVQRDLGALSAADLRAAVAAAEAEEAERPYDLDAGPLVRVTVLKSGDAERAVVLAAHSAVSDGWSLDVLLEDLGRLYTSLGGLGAPSRLPVHGFGDFVARRATAEVAAQAEQARASWRRQLTPPPPPLALPYDRPRPAARTYGARAAALTVRGDAMAAAKAFARSQGVSFFSVLFAAFVAQLQRRSGATDLLVGVSFAGHPAAGMEDVAGHLVSVVPVRVRASGDEKFSDLCRRCHATILDASGNAAVGIEELAGELGLSRDPSRAPLAAVFTLVREYLPGELKFGGAQVTYQAVPRHGTLAELDLSVTEAADRLVLAALGNADLASQPWLDGFVQELGGLLAESCVVADGAAAVAMSGASAPKDGLERYLVEVWKQTLGVPEVGAETSFYELGGHSLLAVQVFNELHQKYKVRLPLSALVEHNSVRALATYLRGIADIPDETAKPAETAKAAEGTKPAEAPQAVEAPRPKGPVWNTVVALQPQGDLPPFFCVAGVGGNPMNLRHLAAALGKRQPFYALQHRGVDGVLRPHETVEQMAVEFLADIRRTQPKGPYYLGGFSFGGLAAYDVARLLLQEGEQVGGVVLLDTSSPHVLKWSFKDRILSHWSNIRSVGPGYIKERAIANARRRRENRERRERAEAAEKDAFTYRIDLVTELSNRAELSYGPKPLDVEVVLIKSEFRVRPVDGIGYPPHESNGWRSLVGAGKLDIRLVSSSHLDMVTEPFAPETARHIAEGLAGLRAKADRARVNLKAG
jgi:amino acid adenylation domain-containing protein